VPIHPLPQFEADLKEQLAEEDRKAYDALQVPKTLVVRFGSMKLIGEFRHQGSAKPGCGSKLVVRTFRGTELGEMLTSTCPNSGCSKSVSRQDMLQYIENSGGADYPFYTEGRVVRVAAPQDLDRQAKIEQSKHELTRQARVVAERLNVPVKIVEVEPILGGESHTIFYLSEEKPELRELARELGHALRTRVDLRGVGARDEARLTADYEKCGQYCCCKNFLKVLRPVSMKSAKVQKATLDPVKISGRCGRLMCCLRYEDQTYEELSKRLPRKKSRVGTPEGDGLVVDGQILTQLALVLLDEPGPDGKLREVAIPVEHLTPPVNAAPPERREPQAIGPSSRDRAQRPSRGPRPAGPGGQSATGPRLQSAEPSSQVPPASPQAPTAPMPSQTTPQPKAFRSARPDQARARRPDGQGPPPQQRPPSGSQQPPRPAQPPRPPSPRDEIDDLLGGDLLADDPLMGGPPRGAPRRSDAPRGPGAQGGPGESGGPRPGKRKRRGGGGGVGPGGSGGGGGPGPGPNPGPPGP
jgi:cell fate regulator YaaT (PSP1 superfamily)